MTKRPNPGSAHDALVRMFDSIGEAHGERGAPSEGIPVAAGFLDLFHTTLRKQLDPDQPGELGFGRVAQLTRQFGCTDAAEHLALCAGGVFIPMPAGSGRIAELSAGAMLEMGEAMTSIFASTAAHSEAGTELSTGEADKALPLIGDAIAMLTSLYSEVAAKGSGRKARG